MTLLLVGLSTAVSSKSIAQMDPAMIAHPRRTVRIWVVFNCMKSSFNSNELECIRINLSYSLWHDVLTVTAVHRASLDRSPRLL